VSDEGLREEEVRRIAAEVRSLRAGGVLGALCLEALSRQAEGRTLFAGREWVERRARDLGVVSSESTTSVGDAVEVLARGPETTTERAVVAALAARGLAVRLAELRDDAAQRRAVLARFVRHAEWLEAQTEYAPLRMAAAVLDASEWRAVCRTLGSAVVDDEGPATDAATLARQAARLGALAAAVRGNQGDDARAAPAREALSRAAHEARTKVVRTAAAALLAETLGAAGWAEAGDERLPSDGHGESGAMPDAGGTPGAPTRTWKAVSVTGRVARVPRGLAVEALRWVSGVALLTWLARGVAALFGVRVEAEVTVMPGLGDEGAGEVHEHGGAKADGEGPEAGGRGTEGPPRASGPAGVVVRVTRTVRVLGRDVRVRRATYPLRAVTGAARERRYALVPRLMGATALGLGVVSGAVIGFDGLRAGEPTLLALGALCLLGGAGLDLLLDAVGGGRRGAVAFTLRIAGEPALRVVGPTEAEAERMLSAIETFERGRRE
jgi:hypothetical protein